MIIEPNIYEWLGLVNKNKLSPFPEKFCFVKEVICPSIQKGNWYENPAPKTENELDMFWNCKF